MECIYRPQKGKDESGRTKETKRRTAQRKEKQIIYVRWYF